MSLTFNSASSCINTCMQVGNNNLHVSSALRHLLYSTLLSVNKQLTLCLTEAYMALSDCLSGRQSSASLHRAQAVSLIPSPLNHSRYSSQHQYIGPLCACVYHQSFHTFSKKLAASIGSQLQVCLKKQKLPRVAVQSLPCSEESSLDLDLHHCHG